MERDFSKDSMETRRSSIDEGSKERAFRSNSDEAGDTRDSFGRERNFAKSDIASALLALADSILKGTGLSLLDPS